MNSEAMVERYRLWLLQVLSTLFAMAGMQPGGESSSRLPNPTRRAIARVLLPAESAARRLFYFVADRLPEPPVHKPDDSSGEKKARKCGLTPQKARRSAVFRLRDRRAYLPELADSSRRFARGPGPRIWFFDGRDPPFPATPEKPPRDPEAARRLSRRMQALFGALQDVTKQARRMQRLIQKFEQAPPGPNKRGPIRPGFPPGYRAAKTHDVDDILSECHRIITRRQPAPDTS